MIKGLRTYQSELKKIGQMSVIGLCILAFGTACTTVEGTNAFADGNTFEREVMKETLRGIGMIEREKKELETNQRAELVVPKSTQNLPPPSQTQLANLPKDSDRVDYDRTKLSDAQIKRLAQARVVDDADVPVGRNLTAQEFRILAKRMARYQERRKQLQNVRTELYQPPEAYLTTGNSTNGGSSKDLICLTHEDELVAIDDPKCPSDIREALKEG